MPVTKNKGPCSRSAAMVACCHYCMCEYVDGKVDCREASCPLYFWMPYRKLQPNPAFTLIDHRRVGRCLKSDTKKDLSYEEWRDLVAKLDPNPKQAEASHKATRVKQRQN
jgi:hypothetical protein